MMGVSQYQYKYDVDGNGFQDAEAFDCVWPRSRLPYVAEEAAKLYHDDGGFDGDWPIELTVFNMDGSTLGRFQIEREYEPTFSATRVGVP